MGKDKDTAKSIKMARLEYDRQRRAAAGGRESSSPSSSDSETSRIRDVSAQGITILLVDQNAKLALQAADRGYVMDSGSLIMTGNARAA